MKNYLKDKYGDLRYSKGANLGDLEYCITSGLLIKLVKGILKRIKAIIATNGFLLNISCIIVVI